MTEPIPSWKIVVQGPYYCDDEGEYSSLEQASNPNYDPYVCFSGYSTNPHTNLNYPKLGDLYVYHPKSDTYFIRERFTTTPAKSDSDTVKLSHRLIIVDRSTIPEEIIGEIFRIDPTIYVHEDHLGNFSKFAIPIIRQSFPALLSSSLVSVQPMSSPTSLVFYTQSKYASGSSKPV